MYQTVCNASLAGLNATAEETICCPFEKPLSVSFGTILAFGIGCSYISQHVKIFQRKTSLGLNWLMLLVAVVSNFCSLLNVLLLSDIFSCCGAGIGTLQCFEKSIPILQIGMPVLNLIPIYCWFLIFYERSPSAFAPGIRLTRWQRLIQWLDDNEKIASRISFLFFIIVFLVGFSTLGAVLTYAQTNGSPVVFAEACGALGALLNMLQWTPQIISTLRSGQVGSLSIIMLLLQVPGGFAVVLFNTVFVAEPNITTWGPFFLSATQQFVLLIICIVLAVRDWRKKRKSEKEGENATGEEKAKLLVN